MSNKKKGWYKQKEYEKRMVILTTKRNKGRKEQKPEKIEENKSGKTEENKKKGIMNFLKSKK
jgi:hypothetical protein